MAIAAVLLLSSLGFFAVTAQVQDCSRPVGDNMDLKGNDILLTSFPDGTTVTFACNTGYASAGGSPSVTCTAGSWSPVRLKCERKNCGAVEEVDNGQIHYDPGTEFGDKAVLICNTGYRAVGGGDLICGDQGWMGRLPVCEVIKCESPPVVEYGSFSPNKDIYEYNEVLQYTCKKDYTLDGSRQLHCSDDATFKPEPPRCIKVECGDPEIPFGQWSSGARPPYGYLSTVTLQCNAGYTMTGAATVMCDLNSQWSPGLPQCIRYNCGPVHEVENGQIEYHPGTKFGDKAVLICNPGHMPVGGGELTCGSQGWMGRLPICEVTQCESPPVVENGAFSPIEELYDYKDVIVYTCKSSYTLNGSRQLHCSDDGTFTPEPPKCIKVECGEPEISFGQWSSGARPPYGYKSTVTLQCNTGYKMIGSATVTCELNSQWSPGLPRCIPVECGDPEISFGQWRSGARPPYGYKSTVTLQCNAGYTMIGAATVMCELNSQWSPGLPQCILDNGSGSSPGVIIGILVVVILVIGCIVVCVFYNKYGNVGGLAVCCVCCNKNSKKGKRTRRGNTDKDATNDAEEVL